MKNLKTRLVFITGGSSGIGLATAKMMASRGADVVIFARRKETLDEASCELKKFIIRENQMTGSVQMDVTNEKSIKTAIDSAVITFGIPDILINSAGTGNADYFENITPATFDSVIKTNLFGTRNVITELFPFMKKNGGHIVNISSLAGLIPMFGYTAYGTSKYALNGFTECLRGELKPYGISMSLVCPPEVDTPLIIEEAKSIPIEARSIKNMGGTLNPETAARAIVKAIEKNRFLVIPGFKSKCLYFSHCITGGGLTRMVSDIIVRRIRKRVPGNI